MAKLPEGVTRARGMFNTKDYLYKGTRIQFGTGSYKSRYDFKCVGERIMASTLEEAVKLIDARLERLDRFMAQLEESEKENDSE